MTMVSFVAYNLSTGQILRGGQCDPSLLAEQPQNPAEGAMTPSQKVYPRDWYIDVTQLPPVETARPAFTGTIDKTSLTSNGTDACTLSGLPNPATITVIGPSGQSQQTATTVTTGSFKFTTTASGKYSLYVSAFPMKDYNVTIWANAAQSS
jgi:hypothetical protein